jgi:phage-related minor tail protein
MGFSFERSAALAATLSKAGSSVSDVLPAMSKAMAVAAKEGKSAAVVFGETFDKIKNAPTATEAAGVALDVFGAKAGPKLATLIREGKLSFDDLLKSMQGGSDTIPQGRQGYARLRREVDAH